MKCKNLLQLSVLTVLSFSTAVHAQTTTAPNLGPAEDFVLYTPAGAIGNSGLTIVNGDVGTISGAVTGISTTAPVPPAQTGTITGTLHEGGAYAIQVDSFIQAAYTSLGSNAIDSTLVYTSGLGNNQVLKPYVYYLGGATLLDDTLYLDGQNNPSSVFIFQVNGVLNTAAQSRIVLINGASLSNVYWQLNGAANLGVNSVFQGTMIANGAISMGNGATLFGRGLSTFDAINLDSNMASMSSAMPLPISLLSFSAKKEAGGTVRVSWTTAAEQNSNNFIVERSLDARENSWTVIGTQPAAGQSSAVRQYTMVDNNAAMGANYYRLRSTNTNGTFSLSAVAVVFTDKFVVPVSVFPNPVASSFTVTGAISGSTIQLLDMAGKMVRIQSAGGSKDEVLMSGLSAGNYVLRVVATDGNAITIPLIKQ